MNLTKDDIENIQLGLGLLITKEKLNINEDRLKIENLKKLIHDFECLKNKGRNI